MNKRKEFLESLLLYGWGLFIGSMRLGKTAAVIKFLKQKKPKKILWVTPSQKLRDVDIPNEFIKWSAKRLLKKTDICCWASLSKYEGEYDYIILDEIQEITEANSVNLVNGVLEGKIIAMTGTMPKSREKKDIMKKLNIFDKKIEITVDDVAGDLLADYEITVWYFTLDDTNIVHTTKKGRKHTEVSWDRVLSAIINNPNGKKVDWAYMFRYKFLRGCESRLKAIDNLKQKLFLNSKTRGLIFYPYKKDAEQESCHYHSSSGPDMYDKFQNEKCNILGLVQSGAIGHTYENLDHIIISTASRDKKGQTSQAMYRGLLPRKGYISQIHILCAIDTVDEKWVESTLKDRDKSKIKYKYL